MAAHRVGLIVAVALSGASALPLGGCGDDESPPSESARLTRAELSRIAGAQRDLRSYCAKVGRFRGGAAGPPSGESVASASEAIDDLTAIASEKPRAEVEPGVSTRLFLGDIAENFEANNCSLELAHRIDEALATIPR